MRCRIALLAAFLALTPISANADDDELWICSVVEFDHTGSEYTRFERFIVSGDTVSTYATPEAKAFHEEHAGFDHRETSYVVLHNSERLVSFGTAYSQRQGYHSSFVIMIDRKDGRFYSRSNPFKPDDTTQERRGMCSVVSEF